ncbi:CPBP family intramembrane glutamic endopeptidase [Natrarchaeobius chitinivorans]|uniref:CPBP family intramembrane metalloprotease n=1 Tax=Natrarchaeobius chitinivorans TaxID=1679083 RepID=A0A3N6LUT1_NATCH|nr:CPBP family intramembrane glutamic endopeptidase [Natrarchaeobius chitinivorans]RQG94053.1 CPBP family intramembrane metalloprotease [Natrarchaeobius chitinivorans]
MERGKTRRRGTRLESAARAVSPWGFPALYLGWAYLWWLPVVASGESVWSVPNVVLFLVGGASPLLAGLLLLWMRQGRRGYRDLRRRLLERARIGLRWWLIALLFYPLFTLAMAAVAVAAGITSTPLEFATADRLLDPVAVVGLLAVALAFPAVEEIGLRGYWFDQLQARWSALTASLVLGTAWAAWHAPLVFVADYFAAATFQPALWWWLPSIVLTAILGTWVYNNTRRSVLAVIALHFSGNLTGELMGFSPELYPIVHLGTALVAVVLVVGWGPRSLRGRDVPRPLPEWALERTN